MDSAIEERFDRLEALIQRHLLSVKLWLTVQEFAQAANLNPKYVSELCKTGRLVAAKSEARHGPNFTWRISAKELERYQRDGQMTA